MYYVDGQTRIIEGFQYEYVAERNAWRCVNSGRIITEQQIQEQEYLMYSEDAWDDPRPVVQEASTGSGTFKAPDKPGPRHVNDFNRIIFEAIGYGGSGGSVANTVSPGDGLSGGGGGAGGYAFSEVSFTRATNNAGVGLTFSYNFTANGVTLEYDAVAGSDIVLHVEHGAAGTSHAVGAGGAATNSGGADIAGAAIAGAAGLAGSTFAGGAGGTPTVTRTPTNEENRRNAANGFGKGSNAVDPVVAGETPTYVGAGGGGGASGGSVASRGASAAGSYGPQLVRVTYYRKT